MKKALLLVDIQNDFCPGGALAVPEGDKIVPLVNMLQKRFDIVIATQDWHPQDHVCFYTNHHEKNAFDVIDIDDIAQCLWPEHCIQESKGAEFHADLQIEDNVKIIQKGMNSKVDSYSAFFDNARLQSTALDAYLKKLNVEAIYVSGLATDYCVKYTCLDAASLGYDTYCVVDACRGIDINQDGVDRTLKEMQVAGVKIITSKQI